MLQKSPAGPDESTAIIELENDISGAKETMLRLDQKMALRPQPSQYDSLKQEVLSFMESTASVERIQSMILSLNVNTAPLFLRLAFISRVENKTPQLS